MGLRQFGEMLKETAQEWVADKAPRMGAALAYYSMFSLAPLLLIVVGVVGLVYGEGTARGKIIGQIHDTAGEKAAEAIGKVLDNASRSGTGATVLGLVLLLFGASGVFIELQE